MKERVIQFGDKQRLCGVLTEPERSQLVNDAPCAVMFNAGIVHRVGPYRLHVDICRALAAAGYRSLRMDLSGLGDSLTRPGKLSANERALLDGREACDWLVSNASVNQFVVMGLCSGAYNAHRLCLVDNRIVGAAFFDGIAFRTPEHACRVRIRRRTVRFWRNAIKRRLLGLMPLDASQSPGERLAESEFFGEGLTRDEAAVEIQQLVDRKLKMLFIYTGGMQDFSSSTQFEEMFGISPDSAGVQVEHFATAEHTLPLVASRRKAVECLVDWYKMSWRQATNKSPTSELAYSS